MMIATRTLRLRTGKGDLDIPIRIFAPAQSACGAWFCRYEIDWPDKKSEMSIGGFDSAQALVLALQIIGTEIYSSSYHDTGKLFFEKPGDGYGFPVAPTLRDLLRGDDLKYL
ncbi:MAG: hypothetical protein Q8M24_24930 [Pseudolabrys sp.]|nr:hypothetical protein [Pseudolabrys sp.]